MKLYPIFKKDQYGFMREDGSIANPPQFESAMTFSEGLAGIKRDGKWGFINESGEIVIPPRFDDCRLFSHGLALVEVDKSKQYIDTTGNVAINVNFYRCGSFEGEIAPVFPDIYSDGAYIDRTGKIVLSGWNFHTSHYSQGLINCSKDGTWGYIDRHGDYKISPRFMFAHEFHEGLAAVAIHQEEAFCFIDLFGEIIIDGEFNGADIQFSEGLCVVWDEQSGYIDRTGHLTIPHRFYFAGHFSSGFAVIKEPDSEFYGYIDESGRIAIEQRFTCAEPFDGELASVIVGEDFESYHYGYIDRKGKYVWGPSR